MVRAEGRDCARGSRSCLVGFRARVGVWDKKWVLGVA